MIPGSGNHIVDLHEQEQTRQEKEIGRLECGCYHRCKCDSAWDERED